MSKRDWKLILATLTVIGVVLKILESISSPAYWADETGWSGHNYISLTSLIVSSVAPVAYITVDHWEGLKKLAGRFITRRQNGDTE